MKKSKWIMCLILVISLLESSAFSVFATEMQKTPASIITSTTKSIMKKKVNFAVGDNGKIQKGYSSSKWIKNGAKVGTLPKVSPNKNYMFSGWYTKKTGGTKISSNTKVYFTEKTKTYYAHFFLRRDFNADTLNKKYLKSQSKPKGAWVYKTYIKDDKLIVYGSLDYTAYNPKRTIRLKDIKRIYNLSSDIQLSGFEWCGNKSKQIKEFNKYGNNLLRGGIYFKTVNNKVTYITFAG